jgi:phytoene dehydrogenase-like protein
VSRSYDVIVIGAGHNGLTTAAFLAKHGRKVLVLERREIVGGLAASHEFHASYRSAGLFHDTRGVRSSVVRALELERHGLVLRSSAPGVLALGSDGASLLLSGDASLNREEISRLAPADAGRYEEFRAFLEPYRKLLRAFVEEPPTDLIDIASNGIRSLVRRAMRMRLLGRERMLELLRIPPMCVADWLDEWFENDLLKATLALPAISGGFHGPRSPGTAANLLLQEATAETGSRDGGPSLVSALERAGRAAGVEIRTGEEVAGVCLESGQVRGVETRSGERIPSPVVAASCDPKQVFLRLLDAGRISSRFDHDIRNLRMRGTTAQALLALGNPLRFSARQDERIELARTGGRLDDLERAFDAIKYRKLPDNPVLDIYVPTTTNPQLAPEGGEVVSVLIHFAPYDLETGWGPDARERLLDRVVEILEGHAPGAASSLIGRALLSPVEIESTYACSGGQVHHGEHALDQLLVRPVPGCTGYGTPIPGLYLCGSGSHPGGGLTCAPGALAAGVILGRRVF